MLPLAELPRSVARAIRGVCFDIDDTVTRDGVLQLEAYAALFALRARGLKLMAVTGRPIGFAEVVARMWPVHAATGENGAGYAARSEHGITVGYWDHAEVRSAQREKLQRLLARVHRELPHVHLASDGWARRCDLAFDVGEEVRHSEADIATLVRIIEEEGAHATVSSVHAHAQLGDHDKAKGAVRAAAELWSLSADELRESFLFVGDSGNDAAAFAWFRHTAGVANVVHALHRLPVAPRYVASASHGLGFAEIAGVLLSAHDEAT